MPNPMLRVLLIDDDQSTHELYPAMLREAGFTVDEALDGLEGLEKVNQNLPDIILTGIIMPRMDGYMLVEALKKNIATANIPVVFLSHLGREEDEEKAKKAGVKDFILRDMTTPRELVTRLKAQLAVTEYIIGININSYDGKKLAKDMGIEKDLVCTTDAGTTGQYVLRLKRKDANPRQFDVELSCY